MCDRSHFPPKKPPLYILDKHSITADLQIAKLEIFLRFHVLPACKILGSVGAKNRQDCEPFCLVLQGGPFPPPFQGGNSTPHSKNVQACNYDVLKTLFVLSFKNTPCYNPDGVIVINCSISGWTRGSARLVIYGQRGRSCSVINHPHQQTSIKWGHLFWKNLRERLHGASPALSHLLSQNAESTDVPNTSPFPRSSFWLLLTQISTLSRVGNVRSSGPLCFASSHQQLFCSQGEKELRICTARKCAKQTQPNKSVACV